MNVLVLGAYGLIGIEVSRELLRQKFSVVGLARSLRHGQRMLPDIKWIEADLRTLTTRKDWLVHLEGIDAVVNASGALQSGAKDNLKLSQQDAICALIAACEDARISTFIQISAPGASSKATTEFLSTKGEADNALRVSNLSWVILKPGVVISSNAYGGTSLLRMLAAFPVIQPILLPNARLQTVDVHEVASAVSQCITSPKLHNQEFDLVEPTARTLQSTLLAFRHWLGFPVPIKVLILPRSFGLAIAKLADIAGSLGWRSPMRTTAITVLAEDVAGDFKPWQQATGNSLKSLPEILTNLPTTRQERLFSRMQLLFPVLLLTLSFFWVVSGLIGIWNHAAAISLISDVLGNTLASASVYVGSTIDILIGIGFLVRKTFRFACFAAIAVSVGYLGIGTYLTPELWSDPLGPFLKIIPGITLLLISLTMSDER